jgi:hypothetical protein
MTDQEVRDIYLTGNWTKNDMHTLKGIPSVQVKRATAGLTRKKWKPWQTNEAQRKVIISANQ